MTAREQYLTIIFRITEKRKNLRLKNNGPSAENKLTFQALLCFLLFIVFGNFVLVGVITSHIRGDGYMITKPASNAAPRNRTVEIS